MNDFTNKIEQEADFVPDHVMDSFRSAYKHAVLHVESQVAKVEEAAKKKIDVATSSMATAVAMILTASYMEGHAISPVQLQHAAQMGFEKAHAEIDRMAAEISQTLHYQGGMQ